MPHNPIRENKIRVHCPYSNRPESVYIRTLDYQETHLESFNGCDNYGSCSTCNTTCQEAALSRYHQLHAEGYPGPLNRP